MKNQTQKTLGTRAAVFKTTLLLGVGLAIGLAAWSYKFPSGRPNAGSAPLPSSAEASSSTVEWSGASPYPKDRSIIDTSKWSTLSNKYGWTLLYPPSWEANGNDGNTPGQDAAPYLQGPNNCYSQHAECGYFSVGIWLGSILPNAKTASLATLSAKDFLLATQFPTPPDPNRMLLDQGNTMIDGIPSYYIIFRQTNFENYPNGIIMKEIEVKNQGKFYLLAYYETGQDKTSIASIASPSGWQLNTVFDAINSTIRFHH